MKRIRKARAERHDEIMRPASLLDPWLLVPVAILFLISSVSLFGVVYSEIARATDPDLTSRWITPWTRHIISFGIGICLYLVAARSSQAGLRRAAPLLYAAGLILLAVTPFLAPEVRGIRAWIRIGSFSLQTAEIAKPFLLLFLASRLAAAPAEKRPIRSLVEAGLIIALPVGLILIQPDMGTAITDLALLLTLPFLAGLPTEIFTFFLLLGGSFLVRLLVGIAESEIGVLPPYSWTKVFLDTAWGLQAAGAGLAGAILWGVARRGKKDAWAPLRVMAALALGVALSFAFEAHLAGYQRRRLITFWAPQIDPKGSGYNVIQSTLAVGSGGWIGKGLRGATQSVLGFLPEEETDFAFSVVAEVFGFLGVAAVLVAFGAILLRLVTRAASAPDRFSGLLAMGTATYFTIHLFVNAGMCIGLMPVMGIPLPFISAGGSATLAFFLLLGLVTAARRRPET